MKLEQALIFPICLHQVPRVLWLQLKTREEWSGRGSLLSVIYVSFIIILLRKMIPWSLSKKTQDDSLIHWNNRWSASAPCQTQRWGLEQMETDENN